MSTWQKWLQHLRNAPSPLCAWQRQRRNEALELLEQNRGSGTWVELSRHPNGFIREIAVRELCRQPSPDALIALIERLNDWVGQVRQLAADGMAHYLAPAYGDAQEQARALLQALTPLMALAAQRRADHGPTLQALRDRLQAPAVRGQVMSSFLARQGLAARYLFTLLLDCEPDRQALLRLPLLRQALAHRELTVRLMAITACQSLPADQARPLLIEALARPGAKVRVNVLRALLGLLDDPAPVLRQALLDFSPAIRNLARWAAPRHALEARAVLDQRLEQAPPVGRREWLGILGLAAELDSELPHDWLTQALACPYCSVRQATLRPLGEGHLPQLLQALDDPQDRVVFAALARLNDQRWALFASDMQARLQRDWHALPAARREALLQAFPAWQQLAYLLDQVDREPALQAYWLRQVQHWCDRQYQVVDPVTPRAERDRLIARLGQLAASGFAGSASMARIARR